MMGTQDLAAELLRGEQWEALLRLSAALRRATELSIDTSMAPDELHDLACDVERVAARLAAGPAGREHVEFAPPLERGGRTGRIDTAPLIGVANPAAPPLRVLETVPRVRAVATFGAQYEGPPGHVHGGLVAASLDEMVGMAQSLAVPGGMTGTIRVRYHRPTPLFREVALEAWVDRIEGRKVFTIGTISADGELCAEADAVFITVDYDRLREATGRP